MVKRILIHIGFWLMVIGFIALVKTSFPVSSDAGLSAIEKYVKYSFNELVFLPWKIIPFYFFFYFVLPRSKSSHIPMLIALGLLCLLICIISYRLLVAPMSILLYGDKPEFNVFSWNRILYTLIDILPFIAIASTIKLVKMRHEENKKSNMLIKEKLETELKFLKSQTNPHFLFNTLNNIYGLARKQDENAAPSIMKLSHIMRYILYECSEPFVSLQKEVAVIQHYIELEKLRYTERLKVNFTIPNTFNLHTNIAPLLLLPLVENAFKHGISESRFDAFVSIELLVSSDSIRFTVKNTSDPIDAEHIGIGLQNVRRQLELIYGSKFTLTIANNNSVHTVDLKLPLQ